MDANAFKAASSGLAQPVDVRAIEQELTQLWKAAGELAKSHEGQVVMRACVMNLIAVTTPDQANQVDQAIQDVTSRHPSRAIIVTVEPDASEPGLDAWISAHCHLPSGGGEQVCCEQITVAARGSALDDVSGTVIPLLVANLPVTLWWTQDVPFGTQLFQELAEASDEIIVDTARWTHLPQDLPRLVQQHGLRFGDLNWARLTNWRSLLAQFFDAPERRALLPQIQKVEIGFSGNLSQALLLAGWLTSSLGWQVSAGQVTGEGGTVTLKAGTRSLDMVFQQQTATGEQRGVQSITLSAASEGDVARFSIQRVEDGTCLLASIDLPQLSPVEQTSRMTSNSDAALLATELDIQASDPTLDAARSMAAKWLEAKG